LLLEKSFKVFNTLGTGVVACLNLLRGRKVIRLNQICLWLLSLLLLPLAAAELKVGFVNLERILDESQPAVKAFKKLEAEFTQRDNELKKLAESAKTRQLELDKGGLSLPEIERRSKERELAKIQQDLARMQREFREDLNIRRNQELSGIQERVFHTIQQIAIDEKYDIVMQEAIYLNPKLDMTDKVIKALAEKD